MSDAETVAHLREWMSKPSLPFSWPTDACGYEQHIRFVDWRNQRVGAGEAVDVLFYADELEAGRIPPYRPFDLPAKESR